MMTTYQFFRKELEKKFLFFMKELNSKLDDKELNLASYEIDHVCYRVETSQRYTELRDLLSKNAQLLIEANIGGRPISTFKISPPLKYKSREISLLELPSPKPSSFYKEGLEHAEFVINESFESFSQKYPRLAFDWSGSKKEKNPDLRLSLTRELCIKLHHQSLEEVIAQELKEVAKGN